MSLPKKLTIWVDSREKHPLLFPATIEVEHEQAHHMVELGTKVVPLEAGDYLLEENQGGCIIERKGSARELAKNLFDSKDFKRQVASLRRMQGLCTHPLLLVELPPAQLLRFSPQVASYKNLRAYRTPGEGLLHRLTRLCVLTNMGIIWTPKTSSPTARRSVGTMVAHLLFTHYLYQGE